MWEALRLRISDGGRSRHRRAQPHRLAAGSRPCSKRGRVQLNTNFDGEARDPAPVEGLAQGDHINSFVISESLEGKLMNADDDTRDYVVQLADRTTGRASAIGPNGRTSKAVVRVHQPPFAFPAVAVDAAEPYVAFLESEPGEGGEDVNGNDRSVDPILRVYRMTPGGAQELTADAPTRGGCGAGDRRQAAGDVGGAGVLPSLHVGGGQAKHRARERRSRTGKSWRRAPTCRRSPATATRYRSGLRTLCSEVRRRRGLFRPRSGGGPDGTCERRPRW